MSLDDPKFLISIGHSLRKSVAWKQYRNTIEAKTMWLEKTFKYPLQEIVLTLAQTSYKNFKVEQIVMKLVKKPLVKTNYRKTILLSTPLSN